MAKKKSYPECDKLQKVSKKSQELGFFLEWLMSNRVIASWSENDRDDNLYPTHESIEEILAGYFNIDMDKVNEERAQILEDLRKKNG